MLQKLASSIFTPKNAGRFINGLAISNPRAAGKIALRLFCTPQKGRVYTEREEKLLSQSVQEQLAVDDFKIQTYQWTGNGKKVLLLHGWDSNATRWRPLISQLRRENYHVIAMDAPAHGKSGSKIAHGILYAKGIEAVAEEYRPDIVIGHSFGGIAATYYYGKLESTPIDKMILLATPSKLETITNQYYDLIGLNERSRNAMATYFIEHFGFPVSYFTAADFVQSLNGTSGLIIQDDSDNVVPLIEAREIHAAWPKSQLVVTSNLGHSLQAPSVYRKVLEFCNS